MTVTEQMIKGESKMKKYKILRNVFVILALILSHTMCAEVAFNYSSLLCAIAHKGFSAPADIAFLFAIPYGVGIILCVFLAFLFNKKAQI